MGIAFSSTAFAGVMLTSRPPEPARTLSFVALVTWLLDAISGGYMLRTWIARGGLRRQRATDGLAPAVVFSHFGLATTGLLLWISYLVTRLIVLAWLAIGGLVVVIGLGISTVTVWTPYPAHQPKSANDPPSGHPATGAFAGPDPEVIYRRVTDEMLTRALTDEVLLRSLVDDVIANVPAEPTRRARRPRAHLTTLIPAGHGVAALATIILAVLTAASAR
jgi:manganese efflux pump family protein